MSSHSYAKELEIATLAVKRASILTKKLSDNISATSSSGTFIKDDNSPVTIGDYAAQAIINNAIHLNFPNDKIVGEEDSTDLKDDSSLSGKVFSIIKEAESAGKSSLLGSLPDLSSIFKSIDLGNSKGGSKGRFWALDPIDGTKGFLRGDQFAVCLALIEDGKVVLGVIGCPNLPETIVSNTESSGVIGGLYSAVIGQGSYYSSLFEDTEFAPLSQQKPIKMNQSDDPSELVVLEGVEKGHSSHSTQSKIKTLLGEKLNGSISKSINLDSQVKYCVLASGQGDIYLRLPINDTYREKIWDHAAGNILITESGGKVGDITGKELNFGNGRLLDSKGVIAGNKRVFDSVIESVSTVLEKERSE